MNKRKLFASISNSQKNVKYKDFVLLIEAFGFRCERTRGSHNMYTHDSIMRTLNIQNDKGEGKSYQIKDFLKIVEEYELEMED